MLTQKKNLSFNSVIFIHLYFRVIYHLSSVVICTEHVSALLCSDDDVTEQEHGGYFDSSR